MTAYDAPVADQVEFRWINGNGYSPWGWSPLDPERLRDIERAAQNLTEAPASQRADEWHWSVVLHIRPNLRLAVLRQYIPHPGCRDGGRDGMLARVIAGNLSNGENGVGLPLALGLLAGAGAGLPIQMADDRNLQPLKPDDVREVRRQGTERLSRVYAPDDYPQHWRAPLIAALLAEPGESVEVTLPDSIDTLDLNPQWQNLLVMDVLDTVYPALGGFPIQNPGWSFSFSSCEDQRPDSNRTAWPRITFVRPARRDSPAPTVQRAGTMLRLRRDAKISPSGPMSELAEMLALAMDKVPRKERRGMLQRLTPPTEGYAARLTAVQKELHTLLPRPAPLTTHGPSATVGVGPSPYHSHESDPGHEANFPGTSSPGTAPWGDGITDRATAGFDLPPAASPRPSDLVRRIHTPEPADRAGAFKLLIAHPAQYVQDLQDFHQAPIDEPLAEIADRLLVPQLTHPDGLRTVTNWLANTDTPVELIKALNDTGVRVTGHSVLSRAGIAELNLQMTIGLGLRWMREHEIPAERPIPHHQQPVARSAEHPTQSSSTRNNDAGSPPFRLNGPRFIRDGVSGAWAGAGVATIAVLFLVCCFLLFFHSGSAAANQPIPTFRPTGRPSAHQTTTPSSSTSSRTGATTPKTVPKDEPRTMTSPREPFKTH